MNLKKVMAAGSMAAIMAGSSVGFAADLSDFPAPFVSGGSAEFLAVYGANAKASDASGAFKIVNSIAGGSAANTAGAASVTGEGIVLEASNNDDIRLNDSLADAIFNDQEFPTLLKSGTVQADKDYDYDQSVQILSDKVQLVFEANKDASDEDPEYALKYTGSNLDASNYILKTVVDFNTPLDLEDEDISSARIELFGKEYSISGDSTPSEITLLQASNKVLLTQGEDVQIDVGGKRYDISLIITDDDNDEEEATLIIGGETQTIKEGESKEIIDGVEISVLRVNHIDPLATLSRPELKSTVEISAGTNKVILSHDSEVEIGQDEDPLRGTKVSITSSDW